MWQLMCEEEPECTGPYVCWVYEKITQSYTSRCVPMKLWWDGSTFVDKSTETKYPVEEYDSYSGALMEHRVVMAWIAAPCILWDRG